MKKVYNLLLLFLFVIPYFGISQIVVTVGAGAVTGTTGSNIGVIYRSSAASTFDFSHQYYLYTQAELAANGLLPGMEITSIAWYKDNAFGTDPTNVQSIWDIYMKNSSTNPANNWSSNNFATQSTGATLVYTNSAQVIPAAVGWVTLTLTTPFVYTGGSLEVGSNWNCSLHTTSSPTTGGFAWRRDNITNVTFGGSNTTAAITMALQTARPWVRFNANCPASIAAPTVTNDNVCTNAQATLTASAGASGYIYNWYDAPGGTLLGSGSSFLTPPLASTTSFYATAMISGCPAESPATEAVALVSPVTVTLDPIDEACLGNSDGSFAINTVTCGVAPFQYSVDGGPFGPAPTNLSPGTYSVVVQDANLDLSNPISVTIGTTSTSPPPAPAVVESVINACSGDPSILAEVTPAATSFTYTVNMFDSFGDGWNGNSLNILLNGVLSTTVGGTFTTGSSATATITVNAGDVLTTTWNTGSWANECTWTILDQNMSPIGSGSSTVMISYNVPGGLPISTIWYDAPGGNVLGNANILETVGTSVMPTSVSGTYEFYAYATNGCISATGTLVTVNIADVLVTIDAVNESCINYADGTFSIGSVSCGTAPFLFSVDGGPFGPAPTDLTSGTYSVVVQDAAMNESAPVSVVIDATSNVIPAAPIAVNANVVYCLDQDPMNIEVEVTPSGCPISVNVFSSGWGDFTTWTVTDGLGATVLSGGTYGFGYNDTQTIPLAANGPYTLSITSNLGDNIPNYSVTVDGVVVFSGIAPANTTTVVGPFSCPAGGATPEWYSAAVGGNYLGNGGVLNALGTSVLPAAALGTYEFYAYNNLNGCYSTSATLITLTVDDVLVTIDPIDETCINYADGSFAISNVDCGVAPFMFSVDGGAFGPAPTDLTAGTYSVVVQDNLGNESAPVDVVINTVGTVIPDAPIVTEPNVYACVGEPSIQVEASIAYLAGSLTTTFAGGNGCGNGNMFNVATNANPVNITSMDVNASGAGNATVYYKVGTYVGSETNAGAWTLVGTYPVTAGVVNIDIADVNIPAGTLYGFYVNYPANYTNGTTTYSNADLTITTGAGFCTAFSGPIAGRVFNGTVYYSAGQPSVLNWYDAAVPAGTLVGTGSPLETVGTSVMPASVEGVYEFYATALYNGCYSATSELVTVYVAPVNVEIDSIDASCNGSASGSFVINNVLCGVPPFQFSVDGGAFGPAPTDLIAGTYEVVVQDGNGDFSGIYYIEVGEAAAPSGLYMADITDNGGQVSWTANGTETQWNVEWGLPGFVPGTGQEIGSAVVSDTFAIITGLASNEEFDVYVSANCGVASVNLGWSPITFITDCGIYTLPFAETFEDSSETRICWLNEYVAGTSDWTYNTGSSGGVVTTAYEGVKNARFVSVSGVNSPISKLVSPRFDFSGQDSVAVVFAYAQENWGGDQNITKVYINSETSPTWVEVASYTMNVNAWTVDTLYVPDTTYQLAFEGINNWGYANVVDHVQFLPCTLVPGVDGSADVCRLDQTFDLNTVITQGEDFGYWSFPTNETFINGSILSVGILPAGTYEFFYVVKTPCASDTTVATITIFDPSTAGDDGVLSACQNEPINLLAGLGGLVDMGGTWYDPQNNALPSGAIVTESLGGQYNYDYIVTNGVCPNDTSNVVVNVSLSCDYLDIQELFFGGMEVYPNPTTGLVYITNEGSAEVFDYQLTDTKGRVIRTVENAIKGAEATEISMKNLEPGIYMIRVHNDNAEKTFRIVKQ